MFWIASPTTLFAHSPALQPRSSGAHSLAAMTYPSVQLT
jgi:hypothetical protein